MQRGRFFCLICRLWEGALKIPPRLNSQILNSRYVQNNFASLHPNLHWQTDEIYTNEIPNKFSLPISDNYFLLASTKPWSRRQLSLIAKRLIDVSIASFGLVVLLPLLLVCVFAIKLDSKGPVFFTQHRWGKGGKYFSVFKFRSLHAKHCDKAGLIQVKANDPRVTRVGKFLRQTNFDELPQLLNVLRGDMSLVGPRCHVVGMNVGRGRYEDLARNYHMRHTMRPGMTGLAQANGYRGPTNNIVKARTRIALDLRYIETFTLWLDLKIIAQTFRYQVISGNGF